MQSNITIYTNYYEASAGKVSEGKILHYSWVWKTINGKKQVVDVRNKLMVKEHKVNQLSVKEANRNLGVMLTQSLSWNHQFKTVRGT